MFEQVKKLDKELLLFINSHHNSFFDSVMLFASGILSWVPLYVFVIILLIVKYKKQSWLLLLLVIMVVAMSDQLSSGLLKPLTGRLRPSHQPGLQNLLHYVNDYRGGMYSFPSSHACNFFSWVTFICIVTAKKIKWLSYLLFPIAVLVSYSRMYLGVHYPSDIIGGALLGAFLAWLFSKMYFGFSQSIFKPPISGNAYKPS